MLIKLYEKNNNPKDLARIVEVLEEGGIIIYPTDTMYAIGCHALKEIEFRGEGEEIQLMQCAIGYCNNLSAIKSKRPIRKVWGEISIQNCPSLSYIENLSI